MDQHFLFKDRVEDPSKYSNVNSNFKIVRKIKLAKLHEFVVTEHEHSDPCSHVYNITLKMVTKLIKINRKFLIKQVMILDYKINAFVYNPSFNRHMNSKLFTLIIRNTQQEN